MNKRPSFPRETLTARQKKKKCLTRKTERKEALDFSFDVAASCWALKWSDGGMIGWGVGWWWSPHCHRACNTISPDLQHKNRGWSESGGARGSGGRGRFSFPVTRSKMHRKKKKEGDYLLPGHGARLCWLRVHFITRHFTPLPPIFDHNQQADFDLVLNSTKRGPGCRKFSTAAPKYEEQFSRPWKCVFPLQEGQQEHLLTIGERWKLRQLGKWPEITGNHKAKAHSLGQQRRKKQKAIRHHLSSAQEKSSHPRGNVS